MHKCTTLKKLFVETEQTYNIDWRYTTNWVATVHETYYLMHEFRDAQINQLEWFQVFLKVPAK